MTEVSGKISRKAKPPESALSIPTEGQTETGTLDKTTQCNWNRPRA